MIRCSVCGNENLMMAGQSKLIENARYGICSCGKVMIIQGDTAIPTPTENNEMTKALIQDAAEALNAPSALRAVSLNRTDIQVEMQPTQVKQNIANYISNFLRSQEEEELDYDMEDDYCEDCGYYECECDDEYDCDCDECHCEAEEAFAENKNYLLITPGGERNIYENIHPKFLEEILNNIVGEFKLYELKEVELKKEKVEIVKYKL